jgi:hypothetical protein
LLQGFVGFGFSAEARERYTTAHIETRETREELEGTKKKYKREGRGNEKKNRLELHIYA